MKLLRSLLSIFNTLPPEAKKTKLVKNSRRDRAMVRLVCNGEISQAELGGNSPSKDIVRLRRDGFLHPLGKPDGERWAENPRTGCKVKVYKWTGKLPANWVQTDAYTGRERRSKKRGG